MIKLSVTIVTYHSYDTCRRAVESILAHTAGVQLTLYVVDNASGDDTLERLKREFPAVVTIQNPHNKGFGNGHNTVLPLLTSDYHAIINPDIVVDTNVLGDIVSFLQQHPDIGLATPKILNLDGSDQQLPKRDPTVCALVGRRIPLRALEREVRHYQMLDEPLGDVIDIEFATGCFIVMRTDIFRAVGGFDERFFIYYEDMDITRRARALKRAVYWPHGYAYHAWERSSAHSVKYFLILVQGMFKYFGKWGWRFRYAARKGRHKQ